MATHKLLLLPGDGIGPEVMGEVKRLIDWLNSAGIAKFETDTGLVGGLRLHHGGVSDGDLVGVVCGAADQALLGFEPAEPVLVHPGNQFLHLGRHFRPDTVAGKKKELVSGHGRNLASFGSGDCQRRELLDGAAVLGKVACRKTRADDTMAQRGTVPPTGDQAIPEA